MQSNVMKRYLWTGSIVTAWALQGCSTIGPRGIQDQRIQYAQALADTASQELLTNIVRLRYLDSPAFLQVSSISSSLNWHIQSSATVGFLSKQAESSLKAGGGYSETPTVTYVPMSGDQIVRQMLAPIPLQTMMILLQSGWPTDFVLRLTLSEINGLENTPTIAKPGEHGAGQYDSFLEVCSLLNRLNADGVVDWGYDASDAGSQLNLIIDHERAGDPALLARLRTLLNIGENKTGHYRVVYAVTWVDDQTVALMPRSMNDVLIEAARSVEIPSTQLAAGRSWRFPEGHEKIANDPLQLKIHHSKTRPVMAMCEAYHRGWYFYIDDRDLESKEEFLFLRTLMDLQADSSSSLMQPILTLPVAR